MTSKTKSDDAPRDLLADLNDIAKGLMQVYIVRINGQDIVLLGPIMDWPGENHIEVESIRFGELVRVEDVMVMLHGMRSRGEGASGMSKMQ